MTAKEYLLDIRKKKHAMQSLMYRCAELRDQAAGIGAITYDRDRVQTSPEDRMGKVMAELVDLQDRYGNAIALYHEAVIKRTEQIERLDNPDHVEILRLRYIEDDAQGNQMSLEEIAYKMHRSFFRTAHLHGEALQAFDRKYKVSKQ